MRRRIKPSRSDHLQQGRGVSASFDPRPWGYPSWEHLVNWRLYNRFSQGLVAELGSHEVGVSNWLLDATPIAVQGSGGIYRFRDGREVNDHVYATLEYPEGQTVIFSSIQSNAFERYEAFLGTKGTLVIRSGTDVLLFHEGADRSTGVAISARSSDAVTEASESRVADATGRAGTSTQVTARNAEAEDALAEYAAEIAAFCAAIRTGAPLACGAARGLAVARTCLAINHAIANHARVEISAST
ncbi:MAG: Gfo/Idh/MocA family oxidoreductase [Vicinamibacteraceae bacterium]